MGTDDTSEAQGLLLRGAGQVNVPQPTFGCLRLCALLPSLADGAVLGSAGGHIRLGGFLGTRAWVARDCSSSIAFGAQPTTASEPAEQFPFPISPSRVAVISAAGRGATATPQGLTATAAHNVLPSAGSGVARPADLPAAFVGARTTGAARGITPTTGAPA
jgi:hypothetical protein